MNLQRFIQSIFVAVILAGLMACGAAQTIRDGTASTASRAFGLSAPTLNLDIVNPEDAGPAPVIVRIYQLKSAQSFQSIDSAQWLTNDLATLKADLVWSDNAVLNPGASRSLQTPMHGETRYVGIVALHDADASAPARLLLPRKQWTQAGPVQVVVDQDALRVRGNGVPRQR